MIKINQVVVARHPNGGIGDHLSCLIGAWFYAKRTGRTLVIDWRGSRFNPAAQCKDGHPPGWGQWTIYGQYA